MNTAGAAPSVAGACTYIRVYMHTMLYYAYIVYIYYVMHKPKYRLCQYHKSTLTQCAL
jgi:hypothetical protein